MIVGFLTSSGSDYYINFIMTKHPEANIKQAYTITKEKIDNMKLGAFSVSLSVKDINASKEFYENLGFTAFAGDIKQNYLIMKNENSLIGLFQGMFEGNILTQLGYLSC